MAATALDRNWSRLVCASTRMGWSLEGVILEIVGETGGCVKLKPGSNMVKVYERYRIDGSLRRKNPTTHEGFLPRRLSFGETDRNQRPVSWRL